MFPKTGKERVEVVYGVTRLRPDLSTPERLLALVRGQWQIEKQSHGVRDVTFGMQMVEATAGLCQLRVALSASRGWHRDLIRTMTKPGEQTFVVFRGKVYPEQPMLLTITAEMRQATATPPV